ncbi:hypothetical protein [Lacipirellula parvula]|uniref:Uncharacterized protein n=1 Tax=Lacipirellula parvula TaxID=2650471 RepID=A0A5K7XHS1_9BACT|nr:hypothetical protein [Lacipirellula parvula]BBO33743.1 hypothetical protein PLANPX_3355 [Lacipirellula parvula]
MSATTYKDRAAIAAALERAKREFSAQELSVLQRAVESLSRHALVTLKEIAPGSEPDDTWVPITDIVDSDDRPDDMTAVSASASELQTLDLVEIEPPSAGNAARIDVLRFRATELGRRFANAAL